MARAAYAALSSFHQSLIELFDTPFDRLDPETRARIEKTFHALSNGMVVSDVGALIGFLQNEPAAYARAMGGVGYCMGGRHVLYAAANFPHTFVASACLHGTGLISEREDSPHLFASRWCGEVL